MTEPATQARIFAGSHLQTMRLHYQVVTLIQCEILQEIFTEVDVFSCFFGPVRVSGVITRRPYL